MTGNPKIDEMTRTEWRELGFYYNFDDQTGEWQIVGSTQGLRRFRDILAAYADNPRNDFKSEHDHYGPYLYLKIMTWDEPGIGENAIFGTLEDLRRLAGIVDQSLRYAKPGDRIDISHQYVAKPDCSLVLDVRPDDFDPASADPLV